MKRATKFAISQMIGYMLFVTVWGSALVTFSSCAQYGLTCAGQEIWLRWIHIGFAASLVLLLLSFLFIREALFNASSFYALWAIGSLILFFVSLLLYAMYAPSVITAFHQIGWFGLKLGETPIAMWLTRPFFFGVWLIWGLTYLNAILFVRFFRTELLSEEEGEK